ncbi:high-affinity methionine permease [Sistotremastrum suecicum HHB10207 ss-3]|uniref:High-affinity methionine permease n=1 Tax=Sistotremastrum suecicum HHB10207 ss-3 TaxID=1314776 RepID=A0A165XL01_9AGAM|nr:high-affinity methionine permease [Sistotremastrum suecicum HHB10207 ss-3]
MSYEDEPLLGSETDVDFASHDPAEGGALREGEAHGEEFDDIPKSKRQLGFASAAFLITNRIVGTGIFANPSIVLRSGGSVGMALSLWLMGALVAFAGMAVFLELGTGLPRNGGEKVYLEFIYRKPRYLTSCMYAAYILIVATSANSAVFGEYVLRALSLEPGLWNTRLMGLLGLSSSVLLHATFLKAGLRVQNTLGLLGLANLLFVAFSGLLARLGLISLTDGRKLPNNFGNMWEGTNWGDSNAIVTGLIVVTTSYVGYSNANYAMSEIRDPVRTMKRAAPTALMSIAVIYLFVNVSYFAVVEKSEILGSGRTVAALFYRNLYGRNAEKILSLLIAFSTQGNILAMSFGRGRIIQELGREGVIPFSSFFASNWPFNTPAAGLFEYWFLSALGLLITPPGDVFLLMSNLSTYPICIYNALLAAGLLILRLPSFQKDPAYAWSPAFSAWTWAIVFFLVANLYLVFAAWIPPIPGNPGPYRALPYWSHPVTIIGILFLGAIYWLIRFRYLPYRSRYALRKVWYRGVDGFTRSKFRKVPID